MRLLRATTAALLLGVAPCAAHHDDVPDPPLLSVSQQLPMDLLLDPASVTVSGLSSGGFFAHQFHIVFSATVTGAAVLAGGPYGCVDIIANPFWPYWKLDSSSAAVVACTHYFGSRFWGLRLRPPAAEDARQLIDAAYRAGEIDDPANLDGDRVWLFRGDLDQIVPAAVAESLADLYRFLGADLYVEPPRTANHGMPVETFAGESRFPPRDCTEHALPFVIECGFDGAELLLRHLYREDFSEEPVGPHGAGSLQPFDQTQFVQAGLSGVGYIYVPEACRTEECRLHVAFHGCRQNSDAIHDDSSAMRATIAGRLPIGSSSSIRRPQRQQAIRRHAGTSGATAEPDG